MKLLDPITHAETDQWYMAFYQFADSKVWHRSSLFDSVESLDGFINNDDYINKTSRIRVEVELPRGKSEPKEILLPD